MGTYYLFKPDEPMEVYPGNLPDVPIGSFAYHKDDKGILRNTWFVYQYANRKSVITKWLEIHPEGVPPLYRTQVLLLT